ARRHRRARRVAARRVPPVGRVRRRRAPRRRRRAARRDRGRVSVHCGWSAGRLVPQGLRAHRGQAPVALRAVPALGRQGPPADARRTGTPGRRLDAFRPGAQRGHRVNHVLLRGIVGSTAYGLAGPHSDVDRLAVYAAPTRAFHGLRLPIDRQASIVVHEPDDLTLHEARKFCLLALSANPTVTELLWLSDYEVAT